MQALDTYDDKEKLRSEIDKKLKDLEVIAGAKEVSSFDELHKNGLLSSLSPSQIIVPSYIPKRSDSSFSPISAHFKGYYEQVLR